MYSSGGRFLRGGDIIIIKKKKIKKMKKNIKKWKMSYDIEVVNVRNIAFSGVF